jgi:hypothetical protein
MKLSQTAAPAPLGQLTQHTPAFLEARKPKPKYWLRSGSFLERTQYLADVEEFGGPEVYQFQKDAAFREGVEKLLADKDGQPGNADARARYLEILTTGRSGQEVSEADAADFNTFWKALAKEWGPLGDLDRAEKLRASVLPALALKRYCAKFENVLDRFGEPIDFELDEDGQVSDATLLRIDLLELEAVGTFAHNLQFGASAGKNSSSPSSSEGDSESLTEASADLGPSPPTTSEATTTSPSPKTP